MRLSLLSVVFLSLAPRAFAGTCAGADPNDLVADDDALTACLAASPLLELDAPAPGGAGYLLNSSGIVVSLNGSSIVSSGGSGGALALITAAPGLVWPMLYSNATIVGLTLSGLRLDGNRAARGAMMQTLCSAAAGAQGDNYRTSNVLLPGFRWADPPHWRCWDPWSRFAASVSIRNCEVVGSPCGAGIGISGRDFVISDNRVLNNGGDTLHEPQLPFPYADGINAAVCTNGTVERNLIEDATNMMVVAGPGPGCLVRDNALVQRRTVSQNGINIWPTNVGEARPWWHPEPWTFAHSAVVNNSISVMRSGGLLSGIAVGGLAWAAYATQPDAGLVAANVIDGANIGVLVDGVSGGAVYGNEVLSIFGSPSWASNCAAPHAYTVADANATLLQPGWERIAFRQGPCRPDSEAPPVVSAVDDAAFVSQLVNGLQDPASVTVACGAALDLSLTFTNSGSSAWQDMPAGLGVLAGAAPRAEPYYLSGATRAALGTMVEVAPGGTIVVNVSAAAPSTAGTYVLQWQMVREPLAAFFGAPSTAVEVVVQCGGATPAQQLQAAIDAAIAAGLRSVVVAAGAIPFGARNLEINAATDFALLAADAGASTLVFSPGFGVLVQGSVRAALSGFVIDYDPPCFTQGSIVAVAGGAGAPGSIDVLLDPGFPLPNASWFASSETKLQFYSGDALRRRDPAQLSFQPVIAPPTQTAAAGVWRFPAHWQGGFMPRVGQLATISPRANTTGYVLPDYYSGNALTFLNCSGALVSDVTIQGSGNFAVLEWGGEGGSVFRRLTVTRPRAHLLSSNCDGFHSFSCGRGATIEDSRVLFTGDDLVNYHNREGLVLFNSSAADGFLVVDVGDVPSPLGGGAAPLRAMDDLQRGDSLSVFAPGDAGALLATIVVSMFARSTDSSALTAAHTLLARLGFAGRVNPAAVALFNVTCSPAEAGAGVGVGVGAGAGAEVAGPAVLLPAGSVVQFNRRASVGGALIRVVAEDLYDSCGRLQASGVSMINSTCRRAYSGLTVVYDAAFLEGTRAIAGVVISGNTFAAVGYPPDVNMSQVTVSDPDAQVKQSNNAVRPA